MADSHVTVRICRHGPMMYFNGDQYIGRSLDLYGEFSEAEFDLFAKLIRPGMTVLDVGANIGAHTVGLSRLVGGEGRVMAFEPQRAIYHMLCGNLALNECGNVEAILAAVGRKRGTIDVPVIDYASGGNFGGLELGNWRDGDVVPVETIDGFGLERCDFIKIDVEGMEAEVLAGAGTTLALTQPLLYIENDREEKSPALIEALLGTGYRLFWHLPPLFNLGNFSGNRSNVFGGTISINMLGIPSTNDVVIKGLRPILSSADWWRDRPAA